MKALMRLWTGMPAWASIPLSTGLLCLFHFWLYPESPRSEWPAFCVLIGWFVVSFTWLRWFRERVLRSWTRLRAWPAWRYDAVFGVLGFSQPICAFLLVSCSTQAGHIAHHGLVGLLLLALALGWLMALGEWKKMERRYSGAAPAN